MSADLQVCVAVDAMSGDGGPEVALGAVCQALEEDASLEIDLVGDKAVLHELLGKMRLHESSRVGLVGSRHVLPMDADPARALRCGQGSSMQGALERVGSGTCAAAVSGGSTGALMALSRHVLGMLPGIERPALMAALPARNALVWALDLGANVGADARRLYEFACMGSAAAGVISGRQPAVGLLNIGSEASKGPDVVREAARLIKSNRNLNYQGFVEADEVFDGRIDVVVCDGFAGNVLLKCAEGMARFMLARFREEVSGWRAGLVRRAVNRLHDKLDPCRHNGAPLLGARGIVIKSHGSACQQGFLSAIQLAALEARRNLIPELEEALWVSL
ncbi:MAG TPA: phosphate acyltransferase PlsX [Wenzhouxiangella sp.]|nr:phosphate acyltransferase PlsX [Wenzhouxiangella sp.]